MKTRLRMLVLVLICFSCALTSMSQVVCEKELIGVWVYTKYQVRDKVFSNDFSSINNSCSLFVCVACVFERIVINLRF